MQPTLFESCQKLALNFRSRLKLASFKADQRPYRSSAAHHVGAAVLATWPAAADWTLLIDERSLTLQ